MAEFRIVGMHFLVDNYRDHYWSPDEYVHIRLTIPGLTVQGGIVGGIKKLFGLDVPSNAKVELEMEPT